MTCPCCLEIAKKFGKDRKGNQRYRCCSCGKMFTDQKPKLIGEMRIDIERAEMCLRMLLEGNSVRSTELGAPISAGPAIFSVVKVAETRRPRLLVLVLVIAFVIGVSAAFRVAFKPTTIASTAFAEHEHDGESSISFATLNSRRDPQAGSTPCGRFAPASPLGKEGHGPPCT